MLTREKVFAIRLFDRVVIMRETFHNRQLQLFVMNFVYIWHHSVRSLFVVLTKSPVIVEMCFCVGMRVVGKVKGKLKCFGKSETMPEGLMDEGAAGPALCLHLSQGVSEEVTFLWQCVSLKAVWTVYNTSVLVRLKWSRNVIPNVISCSSPRVWRGYLSLILLVFQCFKQW